MSRIAKRKRLTTDRFEGEGRRDESEKALRMQINFTYDQATSSLPSGMVQALAVAASYLDHLIANPITVNIQVGYGEISQGGQSSPVTSGAEGGYNDDQFMSLSAFETLYAAKATSNDQRTALANFPVAATFGATSIDVASAQEKALGLIPANGSGSDGSVGFQPDGGGGIFYDFNPFQRGIGQQWDFIGVALHEITHAMGRVADLGQFGADTILDLLRYAAPGQLQTSATGSPAYFSLDGGVTNLFNFDTTNGDPGDWALGSPEDANNMQGNLGVASNLGQVDLRELNGIGFQRRAQTDDFEGKGTSDLIWQDAATGAVSEWQFANGARTGVVSLGAPTNYSVIATGDFNRDATTDLLWQNAATGDVWSWLMNNGQVGSAVHYGGLLGWRATTGNFAGNGVSEIVWQNAASGDIWEWLLVGGQRFADIYLGQKVGWSFAGSGDFNGDGATDLLLQRNNGAVWDWTMSKGYHTGSNFLGNLTGWTYLGAGDFNGDNTTDLLWRNNSTNDVQEWLMGNGLVAGKADLGVVAGAQLVATGDYWGTGASDIVWQNTSTGATTIWAMLNGQHVSAYDLNLGSTAGLHGV